MFPFLDSSSPPAVVLQSIYLLSYLLLYLLIPPLPPRFPSVVLAHLLFRCSNRFVNCGPEFGASARLSLTHHVLAANPSNRISVYGRASSDFSL